MSPSAFTHAWPFSQALMHELYRTVSGWTERPHAFA
eukprot:CAMPEP_0113993458 /NCGR_PEP_ID=MMETSP0328-20130328/10155_1 /TAXON_ID=39455 /ORGANISM="Alexandrium minutum" /LENGTH=35 /assembly_acc=CAM_ASM_000350